MASISFFGSNLSLNSLTRHEISPRRRSSVLRQMLSSVVIVAVVMVIAQLRGAKTAISD